MQDGCQEKTENHSLTYRNRKVYILFGYVPVPSIYLRIESFSQLYQ
jgi:hypothetical protein